MLFTITWLSERQSLPEAIGPFHAVWRVKIRVMVGRVKVVFGVRIVENEFKVRKVCIVGPG